MSSQTATIAAGEYEVTVTLIGTAANCPCTNISVTEDNPSDGNPNHSFTTDVDQHPGTVTITYDSLEQGTSDKDFTITFLDAAGDPHITPMFGDKYDL